MATPPVLERPLHTERLTLRPATVHEADIIWRFRQLDSVNEWLTGCPTDIAGYRDLFADPERLATTVVIQLGHSHGWTPSPTRSSRTNGGEAEA